MLRTKNRKPKVTEEKPKNVFLENGNILIDVTEEVIKSGNRTSARMCPLALAANECVPGAMFSLVTHDTLSVYMGKQVWKHYALDEVVAIMVVEYDCDGKMSPFKWEFKPC